ncbi:PSD1 and planctomycete cytochrome C domain-containing protein [Stieleria sp. TO1_6]|uniref:PSD1 and planctomycete cytochrome C domain-containing protein n=1 Tax=Stieleria tagensis TaxID=2956795 RepID=UPI00209B14DF|nr:PSD1 and planctomycete cytochrome C domain-containing protein [Stieleria tagensis]MCO8123497.1 PSD1 and planctomycete cytochrome C domain-containing protein [Stieleria tagensis]
MLVCGDELIAAETPFFETEIRPIFREYCFDCHGAIEEIEGGLDLRLVHLMLSGGDSGSAIAPGNPDDSLLLARIRDGDMPPGETRVPKDKIAVLEEWIRNGAKTRRGEPNEIGPGIPITEEERNYWAYQPITRPRVPMLDAENIRNPIDALIAAAMPDGLTFSPDADRHTIIQRVYYDLIGLPPTIEQLKHWSELEDAGWYKQLIDQLLGSPHYGERWARHWLDAAGYADSDGYTVADNSREWAWRYRDYVVSSFNDDKPFDQFIIQQIAGDELAGPKSGDWTDRQIELLTATGFLRMAADGTGSGDNSPEARNKTIADTLQIVCSTMLGSSVHCAQCHDHRYDPISHVDYFAIRAVFAPALDWQAWKPPAQRLVSLYTEQDRATAALIEEEVKEVGAERAIQQAAFISEVFEQELLKFEQPLRSQLRIAYETPSKDRNEEHNKLLASHPSINITPGVLYQYRPDAAETLKEMDAKMAEMRAKKPTEEFLLALVEPPGHVPVTHLFHRGDFNQPKQEVQPAALTVAAPEAARVEFPADDPTLPTTGRRLAFARWLTDRGNPLTARAIVNRMWMHHFGQGIVSTPGEFGRLGSEPTHAALLDWLANDFIDHGWSLKHLHRRILTSTTWRQSSYRRPEGETIDAENQYYWRKSLQRVDAEILRDSMLAVSGNLDVSLFGPPVAIAEDESGQVRVDSEQPRRSLYASVRRSQPVGMLQAFDAPVMNVNCDVRTVTTVAPQSLMMLNGDFILEQASRVADRAIARAASMTQTRSEQTGERIDTAWSPNLPAPLWRYGTGQVDQTNEAVSEFVELPHFTGTSWQGSATTPDSVFGWVILNANGGHPGNNQFPAIRRWVSPAAGQLSLTGTLQHTSEHGDGVRGRIFSTNDLRGTWQVKTNSTTTEVSGFAVQAGEAIDIVVDCLEHETSDSFSWPLQLTFTPTGGQPVVHDSTTAFHGPTEDFTHLPSQINAAWEIVLSRPPSDTELTTSLAFASDQLSLMARDAEGTSQGRSPAQQVLVNICQMLINSNEFLYIE